ADDHARRPADRICRVVVDDMVDLAPMRRHITPRKSAPTITTTHTGLLPVGGNISAGLRIRRQPHLMGPGQPLLAHMVGQPAGTIKPDLEGTLVGVTVDVDV